MLSVRGSVIDACFGDLLPEIFHQLRAGEDGRVVVEVVSHLSSQVVRGIALTPTDGLARGERVVDMGHPLRVPVGQQLLGRMFNLFGDAIDGGTPVDQGDWRSLHGSSVSLAQRTNTAEIFKTGIKAIDLLAPIERGAKPGCWGA